MVMPKGASVLGRDEEFAAPEKVLPVVQGEGKAGRLVQSEKPGLRHGPDNEVDIGLIRQKLTRPVRYEQRPVLIVSQPIPSDERLAHEGRASDGARTSLAFPLRPPAPDDGARLRQRFDRIERPPHPAEISHSALVRNDITSPEQRLHVRIVRFQLGFRKRG